MFTKVLVANRGEIAVRVIRACKALGITSVAVYAEADRDAMHVRLADEAHPLGGQGYLDPDALIEAVRTSGAEAVHPGYGFLAENADFAAQVAAAGAVFVGPPPAAIAAMGSKIEARRVAESVGVASVPGLTSPVTDAAEIVEFGAAHGYPIVIKAAHGGGGRGMRVVTGPDEAADALAARRESTASFGRDEVYLERYLAAPRHIEMQIFADTAGTVVWMGERDCSVQRRHQKLIEEAPAPGLDAGIRAAMGEAAVAVAKAVAYVGAGTVEFLVEGDAFYFLEMNTRLQVEHPVTEAVTGIDLVAAQLRVAAGEPMPFGQEEIAPRGHAIELRINAEDPTDGRFLPAPGRIDLLLVPALAGLRFDGGYDSGDTVGDRYDNLVGKLVLWAEDRAGAIALAQRALSLLRVEGIATTAPAHAAILATEEFRAGQVSTRWLESTVEVLSVLEPRGSAEARRMVTVGGRRYWLPVFADPGVDVAATPVVSPGGPPSGLGGARSAGPGRGVPVDDSTVRAPMQGTIAQLMIAEGDEVRAGQVICVLEAMKMENPLTAGRDGVITKLTVAVGQPIAADEVIAVIG